MKIVILGGGGMIGQKLAQEIKSGKIGLNKKNSVILHDLFFANDSNALGEIRVGDISKPGEIESIAKERPDLIYHLASVVSGQAEADFDIGWEVNFHPTWRLLNAIKNEHLASAGSYRPKFIFTSSIAVFGGPYPEKISDDFLCAPQTSYGAQKVICEAMISDFSRKGFIDGVSMRLPTVCVRPGKANLAASSFFSSIIREPLNNLEVILPVRDSVRHWHVSPRSAIGFLIYAAGLNFDELGTRRSLNLPGVSCTVAEQIEALRAISGQEAVDKIKFIEDKKISAIVSGWPENFDPIRALGLGFVAEKDFSEIIMAYIEDDLRPILN